MVQRGLEEERLVAFGTRGVEDVDGDRDSYGIEIAAQLQELLEQAICIPVLSNHCTSHEP